MGKQSHYELKHFHIYHNLRIPNYYHKRHMFLHNQYMIHYHIQGSQNTAQKQNIQIGNLTGQVKDNKWDYFNGSPIHYTSSQRSVYKQNIMTLNENTDLFSAHFNLDQSNSNGAVVFNNETYILNSISKSDFLNITNWDKTWLQHYDAFYAAKDKMVSVAVNRYKQIIVLTEKKTVIGIDSLQGSILWKAMLPIDAKVVSFEKMHEKHPTNGYGQVKVVYDYSGGGYQAVVVIEGKDGVMETISKG